MKQLTIIVLFSFCALSVNSQWIQQTSGTTAILTETSFINNLTGYVVGTGGVILRTTNSGTNWVNQPNGSGGANLWSVITISSTNAVAAGDNAIIATSNGGATWTLITPPVSTLWRGLCFVDNNTGYLVGNTGTLLTTTDAGFSWTQLTSGTTDWLFDVSFPTATTGYASGFNSRIIKTTNSGTSWTSSVITGSGNLRGLFFVSNDTGFAIDDDGKIFKTVNGASSWTQQTSGTANTLFDIHFVNSLTGSVCGGTNTLLRTTNGGNSWALQYPGLSTRDYYGISFPTVMNGWTVGDNGTILNTVTGGLSPALQPFLVAPVNNAINVATNPLLDWDSVANADSYQIQVGTDSSFTSPTLDTNGILTARLQLPNNRLLNNTLYYWRVRGFNALGGGIWSVNFRFTTIVAVPGPPNLLIPVNNASSVSLNPTFDWDSTSPAQFYRLQCSFDSLFAAPEIDVSGITISQYILSNPPLRNNTRYYWRVNATNLAGTGPYSNISRFSTLITLPPAPILSFPQNGATAVPLNITLDWYDDVSATSYKLQVATDSLFNTIILDSSTLVSSNCQMPGGLLNNITNYYWRVRVTNSIGTGPYSEIWRFTTVLAPPIAPTLIFPVNGSTNVTLIPVMDWNDVPFAASYRIQVSTDSTFGTFILNIGGLTTSQYTVGGGTFTVGTRYHWRVNATNSAGTSSYSAVWNFTTVVGAPVAPPTLLLPVNGATAVSVTPFMDWTDVFASENYKLQISTDSTFGTINVDTNVANSQINIPAGRLNGLTRYYWRARGQNSGGVGPWSVTFRFNTGPIGIQQIGTEIPKEFILYNNYPNPFNPTTIIVFDLPSNTSPFNENNTTLIIYNILGQSVKTLVNEHLNPGKYQIQFNASGLSSGIYFYSIVSGNFHDVKKMLLVK